MILSTLEFNKGRIELDLSIEALDSFEAPLSNDFWYGFGIGAATGLALVGIGVAVIT